MGKGELLWLLRILVGASDATLEGIETVRGASCQKLGAHVDMARASASSPTGLKAPAVERFEDLLALPVTVWIDRDHVRRVQFDECEPHKLTLELWDFGLRTEELTGRDCRRSDHRGKVHTLQADGGVGINS
jgi:hypothetical protein